MSVKVHHSDCLINNFFSYFFAFEKSKKNLSEMARCIEDGTDGLCVWCVVCMKKFSVCVVCVVCMCVWYRVLSECF